MFTVDQISEERLEELYEVSTTENPRFAELQERLEPILQQAKQAGLNVHVLESVVFEMVSAAVEESFIFGLNSGIRRRSA